MCVLKVQDAQSVTSLMLNCALESVRREVQNLKTGKHENKQRNHEGAVTTDEKVVHESSGHNTYDPRRATYARVRGASRLSHKAVKLHPSTVPRFRSQDPGWLWPTWRTTHGENLFAKAMHCKGAKFDAFDLI